MLSLEFANVILTFSAVWRLRNESISPQSFSALGVQDVTQPLPSVAEAGQVRDTKEEGSYRVLLLPE